MDNKFLTPSEIADFTVNVGVKKANLSVVNQFILGILAGAFIAFGAQASNMATHTISDVSTAKLIGGLIFPAGLILVLMAGAELFTGNSLMFMALCERKITLTQLLRSWIVVYVGNLAGSVLVAALISWSGQLSYTSRRRNPQGSCWENLSAVHSGFRAGDTLQLAGMPRGLGLFRGEGWHQ